MSIHPTLSAPLPWLTAAAKLFAGNNKMSRHQPLWKLFVLPRTLSFTKDGKIFIAALLIIGIAAINTGNNLLYLVVAMMLSIIVISGILSESTLRSIEVKRTFPGHVFAGKPVMVKWGISNTKRVFPSFSITIDEAPVNNEFTAESGYIIKLPARASVTHTHPYTFNNRGLHQLRGFTIRTRFPFGFFLKGRRLFAATDVLVYPNIKSLKYTTAAAFLKSGEAPERMKGHSANLYNIRDYTLVDDSRIIHWKSTAKTSRLMAKEFEQEGTKKVKIVFHNADDLSDRFEELVEEAAGMADYCIRAGFEVGLKTLTLELPCRRGKEQLYRILGELALIKPVAGDKKIPLSVRLVSQ
jgi:uncharacterized protein (DUF58 family)